MAAASRWSTAASPTTAAPARWSTTWSPGAGRRCPPRRASPLSAHAERPALWAEPLVAAIPARIRDATIAAGHLRVMVDADLTSWEAWNQFAGDFAEATGARIVEIDDGGITGHGFHDHRRKLNAPVLQSPKRNDVPLPAGLRTCPVRDPTPLWCWSLATHADDSRPTVLALRETPRGTRAAGLHVLPNGATWVPPQDPTAARSPP